MNRLRLIKTTYTALAALMLAACASDELTDGTVQDLPEGMYPLQIAGVSITAESNAEPWGADTPQTRMAENTTDGKYSSAWENGDKIKVQIGDATPGTYTYQSNGLTVAAGDAYAYWPSKDNNQTIRAWYTSSGNETVDLSDQTKGLAYVVTAQTTANFNTEVSLTFSHALAKVRVELTGEIASLVDNVSIKSYTTCALSQGTLSNNANVGEIKMYKVADKVFEANVYPGYQIQEVKANNGAWSKLSTAVTPEAAKIYKMGIGVTSKTITLSAETGEVCTVESGKCFIIDGGGNSLNKKIVIQDNAKVLLKNVKLAPTTSEANGIEINGSATLLLSGTHEIGAKKGCSISVIRGTLTINGTDNDKLTLTGEKDNNAGGCLGLREGASLIINGGHIVANSQASGSSGIGAYWTGDLNPKCGSITINGGKIEATGGRQSAGIGAGSQCVCGDIIITGGNITATGGSEYGAGIGSARNGTYSDSKCGKITISGENTVVTAAAGDQQSHKIGVGDKIGYCGTVTIKAGATVNNTKYTSDHIGQIK